MSLADELKQINQKDQDINNNNVDYPSSHLKHYPLSLSKKNPRLAVRILPATSPKAHTWEPYRQLWTEDGNGKAHSYFVSPDSEDTKDPLRQALNRWSKVKFDSVDKNGNHVEKSGLYKVDKKYGKYPSLRYYLNVIRLNVQETKDGIPYYVEEKDANGNPVIYMLSINFSLLNTLATDLQDKMHNPNLLHRDKIQQMISNGVNVTKEQIDNSFISDLYAYPVVFNRIESNNNVTYSVEIDQVDAHMLKPLPQGWQQFAEDLAYQATPSYVYNSKWVNNLINSVDAELGTLSHVNPPQQGQTKLGQAQEPRAYEAPVSEVQHQQILPTDNKNVQASTTANAAPTASTMPSAPIAPAGDPFADKYTAVDVPTATSPIASTQNDNAGSEVSKVFDDLPNYDVPDTTTTQKQAQAPAAPANGGTPVDFSSIPSDDMPVSPSAQNAVNTTQQQAPKASQPAQSQVTPQSTIQQQAPQASAPAAKEPALDEENFDASVDDIMNKIEQNDDTGLFN